MGELVAGSKRLGRAGMAVGLAMAAALAPATAWAKPKVVPTLSVAGIAPKGAQKIAVDLEASYPVPNGTAASSACGGKLRFSTEVGATTIASSRALAIDGTACSATTTLTVPSAWKGKKVGFRLRLSGNHALARVNVRRVVKLLAPAPTVIPGPKLPEVPTSQPVPPPPTPNPPTPQPTPTPAPTPSGPPASPNRLVAHGTWATDSPTSGPNSIFKFSVGSDDVIPAFENTGSSFKWLCGNNPASESLTSGLFHFDKPLSVAGSNATQGSYEYVSGSTDVTATLGLTFDQSSSPGPLVGALTGSGTLHVAGQYDYGASGVQSCHADFAFTTYHYGAL